jgi:hypothetical protein
MIWKKAFTEFKFQSFGKLWTLIFEFLILKMFFFIVIDWHVSIKVWNYEKEEKAIHNLWEARQIDI